MQIRGEAKIYFKESRNLWACDIHLGTKPNGKPNRKQLTAKSRNELIRKRREALRQIEDGTFVNGAIPTVAAWWEYWVENISKPRVKPGTYANYRSYGIKHIAPHIGARRLNTLSVDDVRFLRTEMAKTGVSDRTIKAVQTTLSMALKDAVREGVIYHNVCDRLDMHKATPQQREAFSVAEVRAILTTAKSEDPGTYARWLMALIVGTRQAERLAMEWERLDLANGLIDLSWQVQSIPWAHGKGCHCKESTMPRSCPTRRPDIPAGFEYRECYLGRWFTRPKTTSSKRAVPLPHVLREALREWQAVAPPNRLGLVWPDRRGLPMWGRDDRKDFKDLCKRAGVRALDVHSARHSMVSILLEMGVDSEVIRQIAGHSSVLATRNYMHVSTGRAREALDSLGEFLN